MKAIVRDGYGPPEALQLREVPDPRPKEGELLIRVHATSVNSWDWDVLVGTFLGRLGARKTPRHAVIGGDLSGIVVGVGPGVTRFRPGDAVFGDLTSANWGGFAELAAAPEKYFAPKPEGLSFVEAATIPQAGGLALQALRKRSIGPGNRVLVNGAGGGAGSFAVKLAKHAGAEVTGVDSAMKQDFIRALGADHVLDYAATDYTATGDRYDLIVDLVANRPLSSYARALAPGGALAVIGGTPRTLLKIATLGSLRSLVGGKAYRLVIWRPRPAEFTELAALAISGAVRPAIDTVYPLARTGEALRKLGDGKTLGKVVVAVADGT